MAKKYLNADVEKTNSENRILQERLEKPAVNVPTFVMHDIFFADDFLLYTNPENKPSSALIAGRDYDFAIQDTIASEQSNRRCFRAVRFASIFPLVYADYHVYGDLIQAETINDIQAAADSAVETAEQTKADLNTHTTARNVHGATASAQPGTLIIRDDSGRAQVAEPKDAADIARLAEITVEAQERENNDSLLNNKIQKVAETVENLELFSDNITAQLDNHASATSPHEATSYPDANRLILRDEYGRASVTAPQSDDDIANKKFVTDLLVSAGISDVYALSENATAKVWVNGKPVFRIGFYIYSLPNAAAANFALDITGLTFITSLYGTAMEKTTKVTLQLPHPLISLSCVNNKTDIQVKTGANRTNWEAYIFVEYVK